MRKTPILLVVFLLAACHDDRSGGGGGKSSRAAEEARIEREVTQRVAVVEKDLKVRQNTLHTIRVIGFILLAGGALGGLIRLQRHRPFSPAQGAEPAVRRPEWRDHYPVPPTRVLELPPPGPAAPSFASSPRVPPDARIEPDTEPRRRRSSRRRRRRNRNRNRNHDYHETPYHS